MLMIEKRLSLQNKNAFARGRLEGFLQLEEFVSPTLIHCENEPNYKKEITSKTPSKQS